MLQARNGINEQPGGRTCFQQNQYIHLRYPLISLLSEKRQRIARVSSPSLFEGEASPERSRRGGDGGGTFRVPPKPAVIPTFGSESPVSPGRDTGGQPQPPSLTFPLPGGRDNEGISEYIHTNRECRHRRIQIMAQHGQTGERISDQAGYADPNPAAIV